MPQPDIRRRVVGLVSLMSRGYRYNPPNNQWEPATWPKDDQTINFINASLIVAAAGTTALGTFISATLDTIVGNANLWAGTIPAAGRWTLQAKVNGTVKRHWSFLAGELYSGSVIGGQRLLVAGPFEEPLLRVPAGGTLIVEVTGSLAGTLEAGFSAFGHRY